MQCQQTSMCMEMCLSPIEMNKETFVDGGKNYRPTFEHSFLEYITELKNFSVSYFTYSE